MKHLLFALATIIATSACSQITVTDSEIVWVSATEVEPAYHPCNRGDVKPDKWDTGGIQFGPHKCGFKKQCDYDLLIDTLQKIDRVAGMQQTNWQIIQDGVVVEDHHDWGHYSMGMPYRYESGVDTVGKIISVNGVLYQRYMPYLNIKNKRIDLGYDQDMSIPLCGCLRRVKVDTEKIETKTVEILYSGSGHNQRGQ